MNFKSWLLTEKWLQPFAIHCEHCHAMMQPWKIVINPKHIYTIGQLWFCGYSCNKSRVWTHSIRNPERFVAWVEEKEPRYTNGFCNDRFCGYCFAPIYPLKNGVDPIHPYQEYRLDRYGCLKCEQNQNILIDGHAEGKENEYSDIVEWYKNPKHFEQLKSLMNT